jgi:hypothetical protein
MKTHFAYVYKNLLQTYHNADFFWLLTKSKQIIWQRWLSSVLSSFSPQTTSRPADVTLSIKVYLKQ